MLPELLILTLPAAFMARGGLLDFKSAASPRTSNFLLSVSLTISTLPEGALANKAPTSKRLAVNAAPALEPTPLESTPAAVSETRPPANNVGIEMSFNSSTKNVDTARPERVVVLVWTSTEPSDSISMFWAIIRPGPNILPGTAAVGLFWTRRIVLTALSPASISMLPRVAVSVISS